MKEKKKKEEEELGLIGIQEKERVDSEQVKEGRKLCLP